MNKSRNRFYVGMVSSLSALALVACSNDANVAQETTTETATATATTTAVAEGAGEIVESSTPRARVALTYDGGVMIMDATSLEVVEKLEKPGFLRLSDAGNNRHLIVADGSDFSVLDLGAWGQKHGDHSHYYETTPSFADLHFAADETGHAIAENGRAALYSDGTGSFEIYQIKDLVGEDQHTADKVTTETIKLPEVHHGLAVPLEDGNYLVSVGNEEERTGAAVIRPDGSVITESKECKGVHGEAIAADGAVALGCEDGALVYRDGKFTKATNPEDPYSRAGTLVGDPNSAFVMSDYKVDKDAENEHPEQFGLIDTKSGTRAKVALPKGVSYTFRSMARGPEGALLLLTTDGKLRFWTEDGQELGSVDVVPAWEEPTEWQEPRPAIWVDGDLAFVTEPGTNEIHTIDLSQISAGKAEVIKTATLPETPNEIRGIPRKSSLVAAEKS
ncbi:MAG: hypothetical protein SOW59_00835 [Corynebacterium sp.]|nr:hypothetical protein [Corynebacterium sp.]